ncbi:hypothetical protein HPP92_027942 [Vanilla planifolia]|uniref:Uncharacterized protein n=1 Tax=Vanilla planifolia TaxID=51239 RepID=A0A835P775_VANPL|nr:hypothetical protein HPP92_027942 [Vanilla planifolia]
MSGGQPWAWDRLCTHRGSELIAATVEGFRCNHGQGKRYGLEVGARTRTRSTPARVEEEVWPRTAFRGLAGRGISTV